MNVLFDEAGQIKAASLLSETDTALHVEMPSKKRLKIKPAQVVLRFEAPAAREIFDLAEPLAHDIAPDFLWECFLNDGEFLFVDCARDYFGHEPSAVEAVAVFLACNAAPIYFHRKGKGRFKKAPPEILEAALKSQAKKEAEKLQIEQWAQMIKNGEMPAEILAEKNAVLFSKNRQSAAAKAFDWAVADLNESPERLMLRNNAYANAYELFWARFIFQELNGRCLDFPPITETLLTPEWEKASVAAFSIDDESTTEIDDAFSVAFLENQTKIGIHIAAPSAAFANNSQIQKIAQERLSTLYLPGEKRTMLPDSVVQHCTLNAGKTVAAVSLYLTVNDAFEIVAFKSKLEKITVANNLRIQKLEAFFNAETVFNMENQSDFPYKKELFFLWQFAVFQNKKRAGKNNQGLGDFIFEIEGDLKNPESCDIKIFARERGTPIDMLVAELMILANSLWGKTISDANAAGIFRAQTTGRARFSTKALPHEGLGVDSYAWCTAPLRRLSDLINQRQLIAILNQSKPPFARQSAELFGLLRLFEATYNAYGEFERTMERFWSLVFLKQQEPQNLKAVVFRENLVRLLDFPLFAKVFNLPNGLEIGTKLLLNIESLDFIELNLNARFVGFCDENTNY